MALEGEMVEAASTAAERRMIMAKYIDREALATDATEAERRIIMSIKRLVYCRLEDVKEK